MNDTAATLPPLPCYLNGEFTTLREARVSVMDRGFIFGDGIYEVVPVYAGRPFRFEHHFARLDRSLAELRMENPLTLAQWRELVDQLVQAYARHVAQPAAETNQLVYIQITRGVAMRDHVMQFGIPPTVFAMANRMALYTPEQRAAGFTCITADDFRWKKAHIKSTSLAGAVLSRQMSADVGAIETIMFRDGMLSEASSSNVWVVKNGKVYGSPRDNLVLEGIRYGLIEQLCRDAGVPFELRRIPRDEVFQADELLLSSATKEVLPVTTLDGKSVGNGKPGPIYEKLYAGYQSAKRSS
ncbi:D-amino acid aminotransferase [Ramlibacter sp. MMS24-I3-19]|uniref:D-amino acid aminotransferase n=1 Tax=Ramlibacter sp. MMS24-I3-19 TaxID=3416606 RepID=UPI003D002360